MTEPIEQRIIDEIKQRQVTMRPRQFFLWRRIGIAVLTIVLAAYLFFHSSFILYALNHTGALYLLTLGNSGPMMFLRSFPWLLLAVLLMLLGILMIVLTRTTRVYRTPRIYLVMLMVVIIVAGSVAIFFTPFQRMIDRVAHEENLPVIGDMYRTYTDTEAVRTYTGVVREIHDQRFTLVDKGQWRWTVVVTPETRSARGFRLREGESVLVVGDDAGPDTVEAEAIRGLPAQFTRDVLEEKHETPRRIER